MIDRALEKEFTENDQTEGWLIRSDAFIQGFTMYAFNCLLGV